MTDKSARKEDAAEEQNGAAAADAVKVNDDEIAVINCGTTKGPITMILYRIWSPNGYDRAVHLFEKGFYDNSHFYRVVHGFLVQFGISYTTDTQLQQEAKRTIQDDPQLQPNPVPFEPGIISYAGSGDNSRTSQLFIAYAKSDSLGTQKWETPIGRVVAGYDTAVEKLYSYGDMPPWGKGPDQSKIHSGRAYIDENFPLSDSFKTCYVERKGKDGGEEEENEEPKQQERTLPAADGGSYEALRKKDSILVIAAVIIVIVIWVCSRPVLKRRKLGRKSSNKTY